MEPLTSLVLNNTDFLNFILGCIGAFAPEAYRLYNLRMEPEIKWSPHYFLFSIPFIIVGGLIAWSLDPQTKWAAFYGGLSAPLLITALMKDIAKVEEELASVGNSVGKPIKTFNNTEPSRDGHPRRTTGAGTFSWGRTNKDGRPHNTGNAGTFSWGGINIKNFQNFLKGI